MAHLCLDDEALRRHGRQRVIPVPRNIRVPLDIPSIEGEGGTKLLPRRCLLVHAHNVAACEVCTGPHTPSGCASVRMDMIVLTGMNLV